MVDLETLSTKPNAAILSIGAVPFMPFIQECKFYEKVAPASPLLNPPDCLFDISQNTLAWWNKQPQHVRLEAYSGTKSISEVLTEFTSWLYSFNKEIILWGNGADFDNVILTNAYNVFDVKPPWKFYNNRCFRTLKNISGVNAPVFEGDKHNALADAIHQARWASDIFEINGLIPA